MAEVWQPTAEHELRRICQEQAAQILELLREIRRLKAEATTREAKPVAVPAIRVGGGR